MIIRKPYLCFLVLTVAGLAAGAGFMYSYIVRVGGSGSDSSTPEPNVSGEAESNAHPSAVLTEFDSKAFLKNVSGRSEEEIGRAHV